MEPKKRESVKKAVGRRDKDGRWIPWRRDADGRPIPENTLPPVPTWKPRRAARVPTAAAWVDGALSPMEIIGALSTGTTFRVPSGRGTASRSLGREELRAALGFVHDPLDAALALAVATQSVLEWPRVLQMARPPLLSLLLGRRDTHRLVAGWRRARLQLVLHDAFHDLALARPVTLYAAAARLRMRNGDYQDLHGILMGWLESRAHNGAKVAISKLFGD